MAYLLMILGWGLAGWCGTRGPKPIPEPKPGPRQVFIMGVIGGMICVYVCILAQSTSLTSRICNYLHWGVCCRFRCRRISRSIHQKVGRLK